MLSELFYPYMLGGAERRYYEIAKRLAERHEITVYSLRVYGEKDKEYKDGIEIRRVGLRHPLSGRSLFRLISFPPAIFKSIAGDYDIIDANQGVASFAGYLKYLCKKPIVATFHDIYWRQWGEYFNFPLSSAGKFMEFLFSKCKFDRVIANSPETKKKLEFLGLSSPVEVIISGIDLEFINSIKGEKEGCSLVYAGRLVKYKNIDSIIRCVAKLSREFPKVKLRIIGSGPEEASLRFLARKMNVDADFLGFVSEEEKFRIIKSSDIFVNPSSVEGLGLVLVEAMACSIPVVAKNLDCYFFCSKNNSVLYGTEQELYENLRRLLQNRRKRKELSKHGYMTAKEYSWDKTAEKVEKIYEGALK